MEKNKILVLSNDNTIVSPLKESYEVESASSRSDLLRKLEDRPGILAVIDCDMKDLKFVETSTRPIMIKFSGRLVHPFI